MKTTIYRSIVYCITLFITASSAYSQHRGVQSHPLSVDKPNKPERRVTQLNKSFHGNEFTSNQEVSSSLQKELIEKIRIARLSGDRQQIKELQSDLNKSNGVVTKSGQQIGYIGKPENQGLQGGGNIDVTKIYSGDNVAAITTVTEQRGNNAGRIWSIVMSNYIGAVNSSQTNFYYSDDNGINWIYYSFAYNPYEFGVQDAIDAEIIEDVSGTKYLYVVYGATVIGSSKHICNLITLTISGTVGGSVQRLEWPAFNYFDADVNYYKPRITSDNAFWEGAAYLYIAACQDSIEGAETIFAEKVAFIDNPYTGTPSINYKPYAYWYYSFDNGSFLGNCDIAWFYDPGNGGGSVMLVESGAYFVTALYLYENADVNFLGLPTYEGYLDPDLLDKSSAYIASNGLYENLMIVNISKYDVGDYDIQYFSTIDAADTWYDGFVTYTLDDDRRADITGQRNVAGKFFSAHADYNSSFDNVFYTTADDNVWGTTVSPMNHLDASVDVSPRPGLRLGSDNCFVLWTEWNNNSNMWSSSGCSGLPSESRVLSTNLFVEGFFDPETYSMIRSDTIEVSFRSAVSPYTVIDSRKAVIQYSGACQVASNIINEFIDYYLVVNHRNTIETWSAEPINFGGETSFNYNFVLDSTAAFGSNEKFLAVDPVLNRYYGIYSGDVNQDGVIDGTDAALIDNDAANFVLGYVSTDVNGDDFVDGSDASITDNNAYNFVSVVRP